MDQPEGAPEIIPMGILRSISNTTDMRPEREVRIDTGDLPSRSYELNTRPSTRRAVTRRRTWTQQHSNATSNVIQNLPSHNIVGDETSPLSVMVPRSPGTSMSAHADQIVAVLENDPVLMEDTPLAQQLRMETLKDMPESLTMKRTIRRKLLTTVSMKSTKSPISMCKRLKYRISMTWAKFKMTVKDLSYTFELWYQSLKMIEGHFGSGVATYFKFLRWLFTLNFIFCAASVIFIVIPQLIYREPKETRTSLLDYQNTSFDHGRYVRSLEADSTDSEKFSFVDIFMGELQSVELLLNKVTVSQLTIFNHQLSFQSGALQGSENPGYFTDSTLYYGHYVNETVVSIPMLPYSIPNAYFIVSFVSLVFVFVTLSISSARSYRKSFIEVEGGLKNVYSHKVFCGWDFSIATGEGSRLKSRAIFNELKELIGDENLKGSHELNPCGKLLVQIGVNILCLLLLTGTAYLMWILLDQFQHSIIVSLVATVVMIAAPMLFSILLPFEGYRNPRTALYITLLRAFFLQAAVIAALVVYWLNKTSVECWETSLAQEIYRLILMDFWLAIIGTALMEFLRSKLSTCCSFLAAPEFDIARNTLNLIYNQMLFWMGAFFSPLLSVVIVLKMAIMFYLKKTCVMNNCQPSTKSWRAAQTQTIFLVLAFFSLLGIISTIGYILTQVLISNSCGPFRNFEYMYEVVPGGIFNLEKRNVFWKLVLYLKRPGIQAALLLIMCVGVYYLRAQSQGQRRLVLILREMLTLEALDKEYLLSEISKATSGQWMYSLNKGKSKAGRHRSFNASVAGESRLKDSASTSILSSGTSSASTNNDEVSSISETGGTSSASSNNDEVLSTSETGDANSQFSEEALDNYDGARIRNLRKKHIDK